MFDPQTLWEGLVCDPRINRDGRAWEVGPLDYHNYCNYDSSYKYGHPMSVTEKVAVQIHPLNEKVANDPRVTATILPIASGLTIATKL